MDLIVISGVSKSSGSQFSLKADNQLSVNGSVMTYNNLRTFFGISPISEFEDYNTPYLGGFHLYNYLTRQGLDCRLINFLDLQMNEFEDLLNEDPKIVALSTTFLTNIRAVKRVTKMIRARFTDGYLVVGGPLVYTSYMLYQRQNSDYNTDACRDDYFFLNNNIMYHEDIDVFVVEEQGEKTLLQLVDAVKKRKELSDIPNIAFYKNGRPIFSDRRTEYGDISDDVVDWKEIPDKYIYPIFPVRGSQGCPFKCKYCNFAYHRTFQLKSPQKISDEFVALSNTGKVKMVRFTDDNLFYDRRHLKNCCRSIIDSGVDMKWTGFIRASAITEDNIKLIKESGCVLAQIGMESGDPVILREMNKKSSPNDYLRAIELLNMNGISTQLYFIIGFPGETEKSIENTINMINRFQHHGTAINEVMVFPFMLVPLSPVYEPAMAQTYGLRGYMNNWSHNTMNSDQALIYARQFMDHLPNVYPHYGIEEFMMVDILKLKKVSSLRRSLVRAMRLNKNGSEIDQIWNELKGIVLAESNAKTNHQANNASI